MRKWTVFVRPGQGQALRKLTKIVGLNGSGFSVLTPYHKARSGYLAKVPFQASMQGRTCFVPVSENISFSADDRVKLSYHTEGFVQFSGENPGKIISGRDPETGAPKGLGLFTHPLSTPVWSGPSIAVSAWGIEDFMESPDTTEGLVFEPGTSTIAAVTQLQPTPTRLRCTCFLRLQLRRFGTGTGRVI